MAETLTNPDIKLPSQNDAYNVEDFNDNFRSIHTAIQENLLTVENYKGSIQTEGISPDTGNQNTVTNNYSAIIGGFGNTATYSSSNDLSDNATASPGSYTTDTAFNGIFCSRNSTVNSPASVVIGGRNNTVSGENCISIGGFNNKISTGCNSCVVIGQNNTLSSGKKNLLVIGNNVTGLADTDLLAVGGGKKDGSDYSVGVWVNVSGQIYASNTINSHSNKDYAEYFEWFDGNPENEDRVGLLVSLKDGKIELANENTIPFGIISAQPSVCANGADRGWHGQIKKDIFGRWVLDENGDPIPSEEYDPTMEYIPRSERPEWSPVGLVGQLVLIDDGTAEVNGFVKATDGGIGTCSETRTRFQVMERLDESHVLVLVL